jgi:hypothetical protein
MRSSRVVTVPDSKAKVAAVMVSISASSDTEPEKEVLIKVVYENYNQGLKPSDRRTGPQWSEQNKRKTRAEEELKSYTSMKVRDSKSSVSIYIFNMVWYNK